MTIHSFLAMQRRDFFKVCAAMSALGSGRNTDAAAGGSILIVIDPQDPVASSAPVQWAAGQLRKALLAKGAASEIVQSAGQSGAHGLRVIVAAPDSKLAAAFPPAARAPLPGPEGIRLSPAAQSAPAILVSGSDTRGFVYGLLELAERVRFGSEPSASLHLTEAVEEKAANEVRSVARAFCSEIEDKSWYYDKDFWHEYLDTLATCRFNRFDLAFGFGYDFPIHVTGDYFHFVYPYMLAVPGYDVRVIRLAGAQGEHTPSPLPDAERDRNFEMLRFVAAETASRGLQFQLGIWTHAYQWTDSPHADHRIEGLTPETHAPYCRDALAMILKACPEIQGLTMRVHGESGIPEGSYPFWRTLFQAISGCGRSIEIDMHAKGVDQTMIDIAVATGMPVKLGAKYAAEHQSLGYHQADIRELEIPKADRMETGTFSLSNGSRRFTRYGYADFYQQGSRFKVWYRLWPGTQRHLLSADPEMAAAYGRTAHFCGAGGIELCEPLTFKGREGSGLPGGRCAYADAALAPKQDWQKFEYYYRVWGRRLYNPDAGPEAWQRYLKNRFGSGASLVETSVAKASRVLPLITSAHLASASNHAYWPEIYTNMPVVLNSGERSPYSDTPSPKCFGTVSPLDPQLFSTIVEHAADLLAGRANAKYSPVEVAQWLDDLTAIPDPPISRSDSDPDLRRIVEDLQTQIALGKFFAAKMRAATLFEIFQQTGDTEAGSLALNHYRKARDAWAAMAQRARKVYRDNISYGDVPMREGDWTDRLPAIDKDVAAMESALQSKPKTSSQQAQPAIRAVAQRIVRPAVSCRHTAPSVFAPGEPLALTLLLAKVEPQARPTSVLLHYRHVNQGERWKSTSLAQSAHEFRGAMPGDYTNSAFPLQYYFELRRENSAAWLYPAFNSNFSNQPYFAIYRREA